MALFGRRAGAPTATAIVGTPGRMSGTEPATNYLRGWATDLLKEGGCPVSAASVDAVANVAAGYVLRSGYMTFSYKRPVDAYVQHLRGSPIGQRRALDEFDEQHRAFMRCFLGLLSAPKQHHVRESVDIADDIVDTLLGRIRPGVQAVAMGRAPSIGVFTSKRAGLVAWSQAVLAASGVTLTAALVDEHAKMAGGQVRFLVFLALGAPRGIDDLGKFFPGGRYPDGGLLETFDELHRRVAEFVGDERVLDDLIDASLAASWEEYIRGIRENHG